MLCYFLWYLKECQWNLQCRCEQGRNPIKQNTMSTPECYLQKSSLIGCMMCDLKDTEWEGSDRKLSKAEANDMLMDTSLHEFFKISSCHFYSCNFCFLWAWGVVFDTNKRFSLGACSRYSFCWQSFVCNNPTITTWFWWRYNT